MYARIGYYQFKPGQGIEVARRAEEGMVPIFQQHAGFRQYFVVLTDNDTGYSISLWDDEQQANEAIAAAADFIKANVTQLVASVTNHVGEVTFDKRAG